jgi:hypothetical protein
MLASPPVIRDRLVEWQRLSFTGLYLWTILDIKCDQRRWFGIVGNSRPKVKWGGDIAAQFFWYGRDEANPWMCAIECMISCIDWQWATFQLSSLNCLIIVRGICMISSPRLESQLQDELSILSMPYWHLWPAVAAMRSAARGDWLLRLIAFNSESHTPKSGILFAKLTSQSIVSD